MSIDKPATAVLVTCPHCNEKVTANNFCSKCGERIGSTKSVADTAYMLCEYCGATVPADPFCAKCGIRLK